MDGLKFRIDFCLKVIIGIAVHLGKFSVIDRYLDTQPPKIIPNIPSTFVTLSILCVLSKINWSQFLITGSSPRSLLTRSVAFIIDLTITLYLNELAYRQIYIAMLDLNYWMCLGVANRMQELSKGKFGAQIMAVSTWFKHDAITLIRYLVAVFFAMGMLTVTGALQMIGRSYVNYFTRPPADERSLSEEKCDQPYKNAYLTHFDPKNYFRPSVPMDEVEILHSRSILRRSRSRSKSGTRRVSFK